MRAGRSSRLGTPTGAKSDFGEIIILFVLTPNISNDLFLGGLEGRNVDLLYLRIGFGFGFSGRLGLRFGYRVGYGSTDT